jgi:hypothetical protein
MSLTTTSDTATTRPTRTSYHPALAKLEQDTIRGVDVEYRGREVTEVELVLVARFRERFPGAALDPANLRKVALAISRGSLPG